MRPLKVIFEDNHLLVVEKPPRVPIQADKSGAPSLLGMVKGWIKQKYDKPGNPYVGMVHRLDRPVGGLVVFAKTSKAASRLSRAFREGTIDKRYLLLVSGSIPREEGVLESYLIQGPQNTTRSFGRERQGSKYAKLSYKKLPRHHAKFPNTTFLEVKLHTGRKHQIRAQMNWIGHPIVGDRKYGSRLPLEDGKIALVAYYLSFAHPITNEKQEFKLNLDANWPKVTSGN